MAFARLVRVAVARVAQVDPTLVGVDRAEQQILPGAGVPAYQPRTVDGDLVAALRAALDGRGAWMVVVHGPSKVGKSRSLFEALRVCDRAEPLQLVAPVDAGALRTLMTPGEGLRPDTGTAALWLDDLEPFLNSGVTWRTLCDWHAAARGRIVVATYGGKGSELIAGSQTGGLATIAAEVLGHAREVALQKTTPGELAAVRAQIDPPEGAALARHGLAAYLVAGPALERKLSTARHAPGEDACPAGVALVHAAVDWSRCGRTDPITEDTLRELWPSYLPFGASAADDDFQRALSWALEPVVGDIALLQRAGSYHAFDYVVRLVRDAPGARVPPDAAWAAATKNAADAQALGVSTAAFLGGRLNDARHALVQAQRSTVDEVAAIAGFNLGVLLGELAEHEQELVAYDEVVARFGEATEPELREQVAKALFNKGFRLGALERSEEELVVYDDVVVRFGDATEHALREAVAGALFNKGVRLGALGRFEEAAVVYDEVVARFGEATEPELREQVAAALVSKGVTLGTLARSEEELMVYDEVVARFGDATEPELREQVAAALVSKGVTLGTLARSEDELVAYDDVVVRFGDATEPELREQVAGALFNKGVTLGALGRSEEAAVVYDEVVARFGDATEPELREQVAKALVSKGFRLGALERSEDELVVYDDVVARFGDATEPALREAVADALFNKGVRLGALARSEEELVVYDDVVARFGEATEPELREQVAKALVNKGVRLAALGRSADAAVVYDDLVARLGNATERIARQAVALAQRALQQVRTGNDDAGPPALAG